MKKLILLSILLIVGNFELIHAEYISPGIQIGINSSKEFFYSYQLTFGLDLDAEYGLPGITLGRRHFKRDKKKWEAYNYIDVQLSLISAGGGIGIIFNKSDVLSKYKLFTGYFGLLTYDYINFKDKPKNHFGAFGVFPLIN